MIGIAIINYKTYKKTIQCIDSIRKNLTLPYKIYLLDNDSQNESVPIFQNVYSLASDIELIISRTNEGYARGNNICIKKMIEDGCEYGIISNNDILCDKNTIEILINDLTQDSNLLLVGPKIYSPKGEFQCSAKRENIDNYKYLFNSLYISFLWNKNKNESAYWKDVDKFTFAKWISGAFFAFSLENMKKINFFDSHTFLFYEEAILSKKADKCHFKVGYDPQSHVIHDHAYSSGGGLNIITKIAADQSERYFFEKYTSVSKYYIFLLKLFRNLEIIYSYGKRKRFEDISLYFKSINE